MIDADHSFPLYRSQKKLEQLFHVMMRGFHRHIFSIHSGGLHATHYAINHLSKNGLELAEQHKTPGWRH